MMTRHLELMWSERMENFSTDICSFSSSISHVHRQFDIYGSFFFFFLEVPIIQLRVPPLLASL